MKEKTPVRRYSVAFKQRVVEDVENGLFNAEEARKLYGIGGMQTVHEWIALYGKNKLIGKKVYIMTEQDELELLRLRKEVHTLKKALEHAHIKEIVLETVIEVAEEKYHLELKKNFGSIAREEAEKKWQNLISGKTSD